MAGSAPLRVETLRDVPNTKHRSRGTKANRTSSDLRIHTFRSPTATIPTLRTTPVRRPLRERTSKTSDARASVITRRSCEVPATVRWQVRFTSGTTRHPSSSWCDGGGMAAGWCDLTRPDAAPLTAVLSTSYQATLRREEGRPVRFRLVGGAETGNRSVREAGVTNGPQMQ